MRLALARLLVIAAFLAAQTAALAHEVWHARPLALHAGIDGRAPLPAKSPLCDFHLVLASVLGAIQGTPAATAAIASPPPVFLAAEISATRFSSLAPQSRGPPPPL